MITTASRNENHPTNCTYPTQFLICCCCFCCCYVVVVVFDLSCFFLFNGARVQIPSQPPPKKFLPSKCPHQLWGRNHHPFNRVLPRWIKRPEREVDHLPPSSAEIKNEWSYTSTPLIRLHDVGRDKSVSLMNGLAKDGSFGFESGWYKINFKTRQKLHLSLLFPSHHLCISLRLDV